MATTAAASRRPPQKSAGREREGADRVLSLSGRVGLAARTGFYLILVGLTIRIALLQGPSAHQANANGALTLVSRPLIGKMAIGAVAAGFLAFGVGRLVGAFRDGEAGKWHRVLTAIQGLFYLALAYVPFSFLAGRRQSGSQQQQQKTTGEVLRIPGGRAAVIIVGVIVLIVCAQQIQGALRGNFEDGLDMRGAPGLLRRITRFAGTVGIAARALVFAPIGVFLIVSAVEHDPNKSYGTDSELLRLSGHPWGLAVLAAVAAGLAVFVAYSAIETRYRNVISAR